MNKFFVVLVVSILFSCDFLQAQSQTFFDKSSVDEFFRLTDKISLGEEPSEKEWHALFETQGYKKCIAETFNERGEFTRKAINLAFSSTKIDEKNKLTNMAVAEIVSDWEALLLRVMLDNFLDMKKNKSAIQEQMQTINGVQLLTKARERLKNFLVNPVDSLISPIPVSFLCMEPDALSLYEGIVWDANLFCKTSEEERIDLLAHEMFHTYRRHFTASKNKGLIALLDTWQNEGIADLIDKKTLSDLSNQFIIFGLPKSYVDTYNEIYERTPQTIKELEKLTLSFLHNEISEKEYNSKLSGFVQFGGHPNAYYISTTIKNAGFEKELISTFASPIEFVKLYNKSIAKEYVLSDEFMDYVESLK